MVNQERQPRLSTADMAAAARRPQVEEPTTTAQIQDDALPIAPPAEAPQIAPQTRKRPPVSPAS